MSRVRKVKEKFPHSATAVRARVGLRRNPEGWLSWMKSHPPDYKSGPVCRYKSLPDVPAPVWAITGNNASTLRIVHVRPDRARVPLRATGAKKELQEILIHAVARWHQLPHGSEIEKAAEAWRAIHFKLDNPVNQSAGASSGPAATGKPGEPASAQGASGSRRKRPARAAVPSPDAQPFTAQNTNTSHTP
jgi:hypothetical protein